MVTINVQGLGDTNKRLGVFQTFQNSNFDVIALQETHCSEKVLRKWTDEWQGKSVWSTFKSDQAGVAFLFNPKLNIKIVSKKSDTNGRILRVIAKIDQDTLQLVNIYGPNPVNMTHSENFFRSVNDYIEQSKDPILFGDFNMVEDSFWRYNKG